MENNQPDKTHKSLTLSEPLKIFIFLTLVLLFVGFSIISYKLGTSKNQAHVQNNQIVVSPTILQSSPTPDPAANWKTFNVGKLYKLTHYTFKYPGSWKGDDPFYNEKDQKIAEILQPVGIPSGQTCYDVMTQYIRKAREAGDLSYRKIVSFERVNLAGMDGARVVSEVQTEPAGTEPAGTIWYPNDYCISEGNKGFIMTFYELTPNSGERELFEQVLSTFKFTQ